MLKQFGVLVTLVVAFMATCIVPMTANASWVVNVGNTIKLGNGFGTNAGEFNVTTNQPFSGSASNAGGDNYTVTRFETFCVQISEFVNYGNGNSGPRFRIDNISQFSEVGHNALTIGTSVLYRTFMDGYNSGSTGTYNMVGSGTNLATYNFSSGSATTREADANLLQKAIWHYQSQGSYLNSETVANNKFVKAVESLGLGNTFLAATSLNGTFANLYGGVSIMNLSWADANSGFQVGAPAQDQLYFGGVPSLGPAAVPEPATMVLFGLGAIGAGWGARRRHRA